MVKRASEVEVIKCRKGSLLWEQINCLTCGAIVIDRENNEPRLLSTSCLVPAFDVTILTIEWRDAWPCPKLLSSFKFALAVDYALLGWLCNGRPQEIRFFQKIYEQSGNRRPSPSPIPLHPLLAKRNTNLIRALRCRSVVEGGMLAWSWKSQQHANAHRKCWCRQFKELSTNASNMPSPFTKLASVKR